MTVWLDWLDDAAAAAVSGSGVAGARVVEGRGWRRLGHGAFPAMPSVVVGHHTGTPTSARGDYPTLGVVTNGRSDLAGPLCNVGLGRSGSVFLVAAGVGWHAGASAFAGLTDLNSKSIGIEAESSGNGRDWTQAQLTMYPRLVAELLRRMGRGADRYVSHRGCAVPRGRKNDPAGISDDWMRTRVAAILSGTTPARPAPTPEETDDMGLQNYPVTGTGQISLLCPVGSASILNGQAWVSAIANGPKGGTVRVFFQTDTGGISDVSWTIRMANGVSSRSIAELPDGTTRAVVQYRFDTGGTIALQVRPK